MKNIFGSADFDRFVGNLSYLGEGMLCIFIVIGAIILSIYGMNLLTKKLDNNKNDK